MKIIKTASGNQTIKISRAEWEQIGKTAGWFDDTKKFFSDSAKSAVNTIKKLFLTREGNLKTSILIPLALAVLAGVNWATIEAIEKEEQNSEIVDYLLLKDQIQEGAKGNVESEAFKQNLKKFVEHPITVKYSYK